jgi:hypothetical protein
MPGQRMGYIRVSSFDQNPERQLEQVSVGRIPTAAAKAAISPSTEFFGACRLDKPTVSFWGAPISRPTRTQQSQSG